MIYIRDLHNGSMVITIRDLHYGSMVMTIMDLHHRSMVVTTDVTGRQRLQYADTDASFWIPSIGRHIPNEEKQPGEGTWFILCVLRFYQVCVCRYVCR